MIDIPAKCVGCPELAKLVEEKDSVSNTLETMAGMLGIPVDELRSTILNQGLDATEALSGIPNRMIEETNRYETRIKRTPTRVLFNYKLGATYHTYLKP